MELVYCNCKKCESTIGLFVNLWTRIGKSYYSPIVDAEGPLIRPDGEVRAGETGTLVEGCELQDIVCASCSNVVGLKCVETPVNHVLHEDQILFRLASVELLSRDGQEVEFTAKRVLDVKEPSKVNDRGPDASTNSSGHNSAYPDLVDVFQLQADLQGQREDINRIDSNGFRILSALDTRVSKIDDSVTKLKDTLSSARRDISDIQEDLTSLKDEVNTVKRTTQQHAPLGPLERKLDTTITTIQTVCQEVNALQQNVGKEMSSLKSELRQQKQDLESLKTDLKGRESARDHAKDMASLRAEMLQMRRQMDEMRASAQAAEREHKQIVTTPTPAPTPALALAPFPTRELDILTRNLAKIGNRASQVETLQMELEILKGRVERAEATSRQMPADERPTTQMRDVTAYAETSTGRGKRSLSAFGAAHESESAPKRAEISPSFSQKPAPAYQMPTPSWEPTSSTPRNRNIDQQLESTDPTIRLTKSGKVDKRSQRTRKSAYGKKG
ncbi:hypothetical protein QBC47DRAFT_164319 [Echria macrotheca]|uniref:Mis18 domain-containing protein n=1 Tax=Echria macrotheca TaxID=438768 RepID=A0AAJ0FDK7_9PEZI|nr:hypothetical protein QBC47DRAFT_164319 [Echria macrotheca]